MKKLEQLFGSKTRVKILALFLLNSERSFFVREITRKLNTRINAVRRELQILTNLGFLKKKSEGKKIFYSASKGFVFFDELLGIIEKTSKSDDKISDEVKSLGDVNFACLSGLFTGNKNTKVDMLLVGNVKRDKLNKFVKKLEKEVGAEINYTVLTNKEYNYRQKCKDRFLLDILSNHSLIIDKLNG
ncbi:hypothetical protein COX95_01575 [bacterium CG_4_10_14_0_2_um_filter_33_32]|nr:MAG: hypothetical protein AUJ93_03905 [bacterium CG2_30_33_46]PIU76522.1 MAG: hypothetical protein COS74_03545 [bacterium CG06_land_8_20_14_3_00_33_50]PIW81206.1 MAG: hypothetical protein COZ97_02940 [bacterium CG_4_8_14_3_um_filter_33_28]PIY85574.1 MAG: hypothetical protein COY76_01400 [bacterium CG_4_10_14_0_8_um_filter_33_57]PIZ86363.1 MAG: hypothetical protein COX95_01575 [bacterium CG_4_10_14_0_2_um_filter_33_32]PJA72608.1 MAG: hypothetical protein CO152_00490 [bacterium CG_4_9_14_3_um